jgi:asparagine synthase (glutamine-hydrolysing)
MCGITGYYGHGDREILTRMTESIKYRGPDDGGFFIDRNIGLGHRRLAIIDISAGGHQPMANEDESVVIVFNGEIYNFKDLKKELKYKHVFKGSSDTEIIIHLYEEIGAQVFSRLGGMFAIAIFDKRENKLILARDPMGKKPLYYGIFSSTLVFGSELKAILMHPFAKRELDLKSLNKYLIYEYVPTPHSIFKNIFKLEPGHYLEYDGHEVKKSKFWDIAFNNFQFPISNFQTISKSQFLITNVIDELDRRLNNAVQNRLVSDVPLGIFLSGGIDSSAIAYYAQKNSAQKIKTFSIGFKEASFDESSYARQVARFLGTEHYEKILGVNEAIDLIPKIADFLDEPMADPSILPTYLLSGFTREKVTVALGGDGGDELFCGYDTFVAEKFAEYYDKIPTFIRKNIIEKLAHAWPTSFNNISLDFKLKKFTAGFNGEKKYRYQRWLGSFDKEQRSLLFKPEVWSQLEKQNEFEEIDYYLSSIKDENFQNQLVYLYLRTYMMEDILAKVDRASMYNSLEVRAPFLDKEVVDFVNSLPVKMKIRGLKTKYILKKMLQGKLPAEIINRKKKGFGLPIANWISDDLKPLVLELLNETKIEREGLFNPQYINKLLEDHFNRRADNRKLIWTLVTFELWRERWLSIK